MTKESIFFDYFEVYSFNLKTETLRTEDKKITTYYSVVWHRKNGCDIGQEISKEEYELLLKELQK